MATPGTSTLAPWGPILLALAACATLALASPGLTPPPLTDPADSCCPPDQASAASTTPWLFDTSGFPRRWNCGEWPAWLGWLHISADLGIWAAYMAIPAILAFFVIRKRSPLPRITWLFVAFIASCGLGHLLEVTAFWTPLYRLSGVWKAITAAVSIATVAALIPVVPRVLAWPTLKDVIRQKQAEIDRRLSIESDLREANARLEAINRELEFHRCALDAHAIVAFTDGRGRITHANEQFCRISGYTREELIGQDHRIINSGHHPRQFFSDMYRTIASGHVWQGEICNRAKGGRLYWVKTSIIPFIEPSGKVGRYVAVRDDVTALKQAEHDLAATVARLEATTAELRRRNEELEQFVYTASHDLKSPLVTIMGYAAHTTRELQAGRSDELPDFARRITAAAARMKACVDDLLELGRVGRFRAEPEAIDLAAATAELLELHANAITARGVRVEPRFELPAVRCDRHRLTQVLSNLLGNALRYACDGPSPRIEVGSMDHPEGPRLFVRDFGPGIAPEHHERIFGLFQRLDDRPGGTGVGLAIVRRIAADLGGRAWVESTPGQGATFWVSLGAEARTPDSLRPAA
jgi:PAS domain S-box-containing protein